MEQALNVLCYVFSTLLGLAVGSFLNVCIYRIPIGKFWSNNRSFCPKCGAPIKAYDNIPLLSYIILRGKCRACHEPISPRYPLIEALNMVLWIVNYAVFGMTWSTIIYDILVSTLIVIAMIDYDTTEIPDSGIIAIIIMGLLTFIPVFGMDWRSKLIGAFCISVPMFVLAFFGLMGMGDAKLFFALGLLFGWEKILIIFIISFIIGAVVGVINYVRIQKKSDDKKPTPDVENTVDIASTVPDNVDETGDSMLDTATSNVDSCSTMTDEIKTSTASVETSVDTCRIVSDNIETSEAEETKPKKRLALDMTASDEEFEADLDERLESGHALAFGPFIVIASVFALYLGDKIIDFYMGLMGF